MVLDRNTYIVDLGTPQDSCGSTGYYDGWKSIIIFFRMCRQYRVTNYLLAW